MGHASCDEEVTDLRDFLRTVVEDQGSTGTPKAAENTREAPAPSVEGLQSMSAAELKAFLRGEGVSFADCFEKGDLLARARETAERLQPEPSIA